MADSENTLPAIVGNDNDLRSELRAAIFELGITLEAVAVGMEALLRAPVSAVVKEELGVLHSHLKQAIGFHDKTVELLNPQIR